MVNIMKEVFCRCEHCLNNSRGKCRANQIQIDKEGKCKDFENAGHAMKVHVSRVSKVKGRNVKREIIVIK